MLKNKSNLFIVIFIIGLLIASLTVTVWASHSPNTMNADQRLLTPSLSHWFGTDNFGQDIFSRTIAAAKISLIIGGSVTFLSTLFGTIIGLLSGYYRKIDAVIMRIIDGFLAFPALLLALALVAALGGNIYNIIIALTASFFPVMARIVRSQVLQTKSMTYIEAAKTSGVRDPVILTKYVLPQALSPIIVQATFIFAKAILAEAALSFLGVGIDPSIPSWGNMLKDAQLYITIAPWYSIFPGIFLVITVLALNYLGDNIRKAFDPYYKKPLKKKSASKIKKQSKSIRVRGAHS